MDAVKRLLLAGLILGASALGLVGAAQAATGQLTPAGQEGIEQVAACLRSNPNLVALLVVDESGSLQGSDPENSRAVILADFVDQLSSLSGKETSQGPRTVAIAVNTFAEQSKPLVPWTLLSSGNSSSISDSLRDELPSRNQGNATDYEEAMRSTRSSMTEGITLLNAPSKPCQLVVWFTDGVLDLGLESPAENEASATRLCAVEGPIDKLRKEGVNLISVLLFDRARLDDFDEEPRKLLTEGIALLQATAEGVGSAGKFSVECGTVPIPASYKKGAFFEGNLDALAEQFKAAVALGIGGTSGDIGPGSPSKFEIEAGFTEFWVTAQAPDGLTLDSPDGSQLVVDRDGPGGPVAGTDASTSWTLGTVTVKVPVTAQGIGTWTLTRPGTNSDASVYLFSDLDLLVDPVQLVADEPATVTGQVVGPNGSPANLTDFSKVELSVKQVIDGQEVKPVDFKVNRDSGTFSGTIIPQTTSSEVRFDFTLQLATQSGFALAPLTTTYVEQVKLPGGYPQLTTQAIDLGTLQDRGSTAAQQLTYQGSEDGQTKVCVEGATILSNVDEANVSVSASPQGDCIDIAPGGEGTVTVSATNGQAVADGGTVSGDVTFLVTNAPTDELPDTKERSLSVPFNVQVLPVGPVLWVPFVLMALGILFPLAILYLINWRAACLRLDGLMMARVPVTVLLSETGTIARSDATESKQVVGFKDLAFTGAPDSARSWSVDGANLRAKAPINPFGSVSAHVTAPAGQVIASNTAPTVAEAGQQAGIGLCPSMGAFVVVNPEALLAAGHGDVVAGQLYAFLVTSNVDRDAAQLSQELQHNGAWGQSLLQLQATIASLRAATAPGGPEPQDTADPTVVPEIPSGPPTSRFGLGPSSGAATPPPKSDPPTPPRGPDDPAPPQSGNRFSL
jgi:hypothetical protein